MAMASTFKLFFFFLLLLFLSSAHIEARVNKFFSKFIHIDHNQIPQLTPSDLSVSPSPAPLSTPQEISPILSPAQAPAPFLDESQNAYGLYDRDSNEGESSRTITDVEEEILAEDDKDEESHKFGYSKTNLHSDSFRSPRRYEQYQNNYENNEYRNSEYESNFENNGERNYQYRSNYDDNGYRRSRYEPTERQGMSDTRFMENGRSYYSGSSRNGGEGKSYGSKKNQYEFDSMEEYEKSEGFLP